MATCARERRGLGKSYSNGRMEIRGWWRRRYLEQDPGSKIGNVEEEKLRLLCLAWCLGMRLRLEVKIPELG
jgi:hypothetical protein